MEPLLPAVTDSEYFKSPPPVITAVRFDAEKNARRTSIFGVEQAAALNSGPFLALSAPWSDFFNVGEFFGTGLPNQRYLFVISPQRPRGLIRDFYVAISPAKNVETRVVTVDPPLALAGGEELFIYTAPIPEISLVVGSDVSITTPGIETNRHRLDDDSYAKFIEYAKEDLYKFDHLYKSNPALPQFTEDEHYDPDWQSWNGTRQTDSGLARSTWLDFEGVSLEHLNLAEPPKFFTDLALYQQLVEEYSWWGLTHTILWVRCARQTCSCIDIPAVDLIREIHVPDDVPTFSDEQRPVLAELSYLHSAFFEGPVPEHANSDQVELAAEPWEWVDDDDPIPDLEYPPALTGTILHAVDLKVIVFDIPGALFNREEAIQDALLTIMPTIPNIDSISPREGCSIFIEYEALRYQADPDAAPVEIVRDALCDVARDVGIIPLDAMLDEATSIIFHPPLHGDALSTLQYLHAKGYELLYLCPTDIPAWQDHVQSVLPLDIIQVLGSGLSAHWYNRSASLYSALLDKCLMLHPDIAPDAVAIVTTSPHRVIEPAHAAGFPTVLIRRPTGIESHIDIDHSPPSLVITQLEDLVDCLHTLSIPKPELSKEQLWLRPAFCIRFYQTGESIGNIFSAYHLLTGRRAAVKIELQLGTEGEVCELPYEAAVHRVLQGYPGIPQIRWDGTEKNSHVIITDRLGPNIWQLCQFCRGTLTLRTVLMLAEQMLSLIEYAHSKGFVLRDVKPENFTMGRSNRDPHILYMIDFGLARHFVDPETGKHIPFRDKLSGIGTARYSSHNAHFGREQSRRDDMEALGFSLLSLLHPILPWEPVIAPDHDSKFLHTGMMKEGNALRDLLSQSPQEFAAYFDHCCGLAFDAKPDYMLLKTIFRERMAKEGWTYDPMTYDWMGKTSLEYGTVEPDEYKFVVLPRNRECVKGEQLPDWIWMWLSDKME